MVKQQIIGKNYDIIKLSINDGIEVSDALPQLLETITQCFANYNYKIILDMQRIKFPSSSFIAFLIEVTAQARRAGGDIKLINLAPSATNNLVTFSPLSYLAVDGEESIALEDLNSLVVNRPAPQPSLEPEPEIEEEIEPDAESDSLEATKIEADADSDSLAEVETEAEPASHDEQEEDFVNISADETAGETEKQEPSFKPEFHIKEVQIDLPDLPVRRKRKPTAVEPDADSALKSETVFELKKETDSELQESVEIELHPSAELSKAPGDFEDSRESVLLTGLSENENVESTEQTEKSEQEDLIPQVKRIRVKSQTESLYDVCDFVTELADKVGFPEKEVGKIKVTVYEACINVIEHAYHSDPDEWIVVTVQYDRNEFITIIQDWGESFDFDDTKPYDVNQAVQDRKTGGFGLFIILRSMDAVKYKTDPVNGNRLILRKKVPQKS